MQQGHGFSLEGTVVAVAADRDHHFSKPSQDRIMLVEGHGVEGDAHAGPFVRHRYLARRQPRLPNLRQVHLIRPSSLHPFRMPASRSQRGTWARISPLPVWTLSGCLSGRSSSLDQRRSWS
jgi:hypothetical protein